jgi:hypothetical protein
MADLVFRNLNTDKTNEIVVGGIEVEVTYPDGRPCSGATYELVLTEGGTRTGTLDQQGRLNEANIPAGAKGTLKVTGQPIIALSE